MRIVVYGSAEKKQRRFFSDHASAVKFVLAMRNDAGSQFYRIRYRSGFEWKSGDVFIRIER